MIIESLEHRWYEIPHDEIDPFVDYEFGLAIKSLKCEIFPGTLIFCGLALEEQLSAIYSAINRDETRLKKMDLNSLIEWAEHGEKTDKVFNDSKESLHSIREARNFFSHAKRIFFQKGMEKMRNGLFNPITPDEVNHPEWFKEIHRFCVKDPDIKIDSNNPVVGYLYSKETAIKACEIVIEFIENTNHLIKPTPQ